MNKQDKKQRLTRLAKLKRAPRKPVGTVLAKALIQKRHGHQHLPADDLFAFEINSGKDNEALVLVSETDERLKIVGCSCNKGFSMNEDVFDAYVEVAAKEAEACNIRPPFAITLAPNSGVFSFIYEDKKTRTRAA